MEYSDFSDFISAGFVFVYFAEKLMGIRRTGIRQKKELPAQAKQHRDVKEYCR